MDASDTPDIPTLRKTLEELEVLSRDAVSRRFKLAANDTFGREKAAAEIEALRVQIVAARQALKEAEDTERWESSKVIPIREGMKREEAGDANYVRELRIMLASRLPNIVRKLSKLAEDGDLMAAKIILERVMPAPKPVEIPIKLDFPDGVDKAEALFAAVTSGQLGIGQGAELLKAMAAIVEARTNASFGARLEALEAKASAVQKAGEVVDVPVLRIPARARGGE